MTGLMCFLCGIGVMWCLTKLNSKYKFELENPKKYHYEEHSGDIIHIYKDGEIVDLLNEQDAEIKRLKRTMKGVAELLSIEADLFSDKATEHDINAYIELKEFDNKDAYCMAVSIKKAIKMLRG